MSNVELTVIFNEVSDSLSKKIKPLLFVWNHWISGGLLPLATQVNVAFSPTATTKSSGGVIIVALAVIYRENEITALLITCLLTVVVAKFILLYIVTTII